jgi:enoyl-CoA hydratase/carnithine racemase
VSQSANAPPAGSASPERLISRDEQMGVRLLFLARPDKRNAMTPAMLEQLLAEIERFEVERGSEQGWALLIGGEGRSFCSGFDLKLCATQPGTAETLLNLLSRCIVALRRLDAPTVIAATGNAIAGAAALCGGADCAVGDREGLYGYPVLRLGLSPAVSAPFLMPKAGDGNARQRLLDVGLLKGEDAVAAGLLTHAVDWPEDVIPKSMKLVRAMAAKPRHAFAATKQLLRELDGASDPARVAAGLAVSLDTARSPEMNDRLSEFRK